MIPDSRCQLPVTECGESETRGIDIDHFLKIVTFFPFFFYVQNKGRDK